MTARRRQWAKLWRRSFLEGTLAPFSDRSAFFQFLLIGIGLVYAFFIEDWKALPELLGGNRSIATVVTAVVLWVLINTLLASGSAFKKLRELGEWHGERFDYHLPLHLATFNIEPKDDGRILPVEVPDADPESFVQFRTEYEGGIAKVQPAIGPTINWDAISRQTRFGLRLDSGRCGRFLVHCPSDSDTSTVRFYAVSWRP